MGGVLEPAAYGRAPLGGEQNSLRGALFLGSRTLDEGAVGCIMRGPLQLDALGTQARTALSFLFSILMVM